ncbi:hypothetical protein BDF20DRAFT_821420 [Mycotypha africana]|uniref:uncharacterized protein n=1 Tax=Mycotypha africana TaxID=64632 RepID=UPI002300D39F|nr:uncharacterized protein BDF20DRAFT_821420 [Mycotypha africana]KAI8977034.1 hypothetical protein BDF20DRAFT_821420 [Mycotypha africana]
MYNKVNKHVGMIPSVPVAQDDICYEYAGLIRTFEYISDHDMSTVYHTFWSTSYSKQFTENQLSTLRSFIATQRRHKHVLYFWILEKDQHALIHGNSLWNTTQQFHNNIIQLKIVEENLTMNSAVSQLIENSNDDNYIESLLRMISLYEYGGIWFDLDVLFIRDLTPLLHQEWTTQSSCSESSSFFTQRRYKVDNRFKGSLMHFRKHSPFLCEMLSIVQAQMSTKSSAEMHIPNYREYLYQLVFYRVLKHHLTPWAVLPWCFTNPSQCRKSNSLPSLFDHKKISEKNSQRLSKTFVQSYYRNWYRSPGTVFIELINQHKSITKW